jgi:hypothetical protein
VVGERNIYPVTTIGVAAFAEQICRTGYHYSQDVQVFLGSVWGSVQTPSLVNLVLMSETEYIVVLQSLFVRDLDNRKLVFDGLQNTLIWLTSSLSENRCLTDALVSYNPAVVLDQRNRDVTEVDHLRHTKHNTLSQRCKRSLIGNLHG